MGTEQQERVLVFFLYAPRDKRLRDELEDHLSILKYRGLIETWHAHEIMAGTPIDQQVDSYLNKAHIILLLISANFMAADFCYGHDMQRALERHWNGEASVVPILLRPVLYHGAPFAQLTILPTNGKPVAKWRNRDSAFVDIALGIERTAELYTTKPGGRIDRSYPEEDLKSPQSPLDGWDEPTVREFYTDPPEWKEERRVQQYYQQALDTYQRAILHNSVDGGAYRGKGNALYGLKRYEEAYEAFARAAQIDPTPANYVSIGNALKMLDRLDEALSAYHEALRCDPDDAAAYYEMSDALVLLGRTEEAQQAYETARRLGYEE